MGYKPIPNTQEVQFLDWARKIQLLDWEKLTGNFQKQLEDFSEKEKSLYMEVKGLIDTTKAQRDQERDQETKEAIVEGLESLLNIL